MIAEDHSKLLFNSAWAFLSLHLGHTQVFCFSLPCVLLRAPPSLLFLKKVAKKKVQLGNVLPKASWFSCDFENSVL